jgi:myo-inositol-1(or 4)-monophosphatase
MLAALRADLALLKLAAAAGGELAMSFFRRNPVVRSKLGGSPVTDADMQVDELLRTTLLAARPHYGWLSEETADDPAQRTHDTIFVVDPIDGTRGFIEGDDRWCVSLALVRGGRPLVAVLNAPARGESFSAIVGEGAWSGASRLAVSATSVLAGARLAGPRGWLRTDAIVAGRAALEAHVPSLAYRFAMVAAGRIDAAFASPRANDWDLAAADLLVHEAGGRLTDLDGRIPLYNREIPRHGALAAANAALHPDVLAIVRAAEREVPRSRPIPRRRKWE